ncbi:MAG TPA: hypothetical protein VMB34_11825 [Acetobacteraceae bacterium]|nr:hypothetical protein [Acetobacteraceae bacterium]
MANRVAVSPDASSQLPASVSRRDVERRDVEHGSLPTLSQFAMAIGCILLATWVFGLLARFAAASIM